MISFAAKNAFYSRTVIHDSISFKADFVLTFPFDYAVLEKVYLFILFFIFYEHLCR
jgi:hypothetical protein